MNLFCLGVGEILPKVFKLDLFFEVDFAILDDLVVLQIRLRQEAIDEVLSTWYITEQCANMAS